MRLSRTAGIPWGAQFQIRQAETFLKQLTALFRHVTQDTVAEATNLSRQRLDAESFKIAKRTDGNHGTSDFKDPGRCQGALNR